MCSLIVKLKQVDEVTEKHLVIILKHILLQLASTRKQVAFLFDILGGFFWSTHGWAVNTAL